jgi:hypothetical protein
MVNSVAMPGNNRAAVFYMRSVPTTIGKLYRPVVPNRYAPAPKGAASLAKGCREIWR